MSVSIQKFKNLRPVSKEDDEKLKKEYMKEYYEKNKEVMNANAKRNYRENKEEKKEYGKQWHKENKEKIKEQHTEYCKENKEKLYKQQKRYRKANPDKILERNAKRRKLGFEPINEYFEGGEWHHINENDVICIPKKIHRSVYHVLATGQGMEEINDLAMEFMLTELGEC